MTVHSLRPVSQLDEWMQTSQDVASAMLHQCNTVFATQYATTFSQSKAATAQNLHTVPTPSNMTYYDQYAAIFDTVQRDHPTNMILLQVKTADEAYENIFRTALLEILESPTVQREHYHMIDSPTSAANVFLLGGSFSTIHDEYTQQYHNTVTLPSYTLLLWLHHHDVLFDLLSSYSLLTEAHTYQYYSLEIEAMRLAITTDMLAALHEAVHLSHEATHNVPWEWHTHILHQQLLKNAAQPERVQTLFQDFLAKLYETRDNHYQKNQTVYFSATP